jgi:predicted DNA-binding ribbon-helix-helix protein
MTGAAREESMPGKRVQFDDETWAALDLMAHDRMATFQELADEAFADLLRKHGRPTDLKSALRKSVGGIAPAKLKRGK